MVTYSDLFAFCTLIIGIIELVYIISAKKNDRPSCQIAVIFLIIF